jgi:hypothetical protein
MVKGAMEILIRKRKRKRKGKEKGYATGLAPFHCPRAHTSPQASLIACYRNKVIRYTSSLKFSLGSHS